jgi:hypothetical protein
MTDPHPLDAGFRCSKKSKLAGMPDYATSLSSLLFMIIRALWIDHGQTDV